MFRLEVVSKMHYFALYSGFKLFTKDYTLTPSCYEEMWPMPPYWYPWLYGVR